VALHVQRPFCQLLVSGGRTARSSERSPCLASANASNQTTNLHHSSLWIHVFSENSHWTSVWLCNTVIAQITTSASVLIAVLLANLGYPVHVHVFQKRKIGDKWHWREYKALTPTSGLSSSFLHWWLECWQNGHCFFYAASPSLVLCILWNDYCQTMRTYYQWYKFLLCFVMCRASCGSWGCK